MQEQRIIRGQTEEEVWQQLVQDMAQGPNLLQYKALLQQQDKTILFNLDIDLGGGFESGISTTFFSASFPNPEGFRFVLHQQGLLEEVGKIFGMQDVKVGYPEFDAHTIVKANNEAKVKELLTNEELRAALLPLHDFRLEIVLPAEEAINTLSNLDLMIQGAITDPVQLRQLYQAFYRLLSHLAGGY